MKIYILSPNFNTLTTPKLTKKLRQVGQVKVFSKPRPLDKLKEIFEDREAKIIALDPDFCNWKAPSELFTQVPYLRAICLQTTSFSWIDTEAAKLNGIPITNLRHWATESVAEWAFMMAMNIARRVPIIAKAGWKEDSASQQGIELQGETAGIIGLGHIGTRIAELAQGMGMKVRYWSAHSRDRRFQYVNLPKLLRTSDVIFPAVAQNQFTKGLLTDKLLRTMKPSASFVSIVHTVYNHQLLLHMVAQDKLFGYAFEENGGNFAKYQGNVWAGPENAWVTRGAQERNLEQWVATIVDAAKGKLPQRVN